MIKHIVMFHLKEENKEENIKEALKRLSTFPDEIPTLKGFEAVVNAPEADCTNCDLALVCDFEDIDGLNAYQVHPSHVAFGNFIKAVRLDRACIDYEY